MPASIRYNDGTERVRVRPEEHLETHEVYVTPQRQHWPVYDPDQQCFVEAVADDQRMSMLDLSVEEARALQIVDLFITKRQEYGKKSKAPVGNWKKLSLIRCRWRLVDVEQSLTTPVGRAAFRWYRDHHPVYAKYLDRHRQWLRDRVGVVGDGEGRQSVWFTTMRLLLEEEGIEVAARPILYPHHSFGDTDMKQRLRGVHLDEGQVTNMKQSFLRKCQSPCVAYMSDAELIFLIHDVAMARSIVATIRQAVKKNLSPEILAQNRQTSSGYWRLEQCYGADIIRQMRLAREDPEKFPKLHAHCHAGGQERRVDFPNVFITIAPGEWSFPLHEAVFGNYKRPAGHDNCKDLELCAGLLALHLYNVLTTIFSHLLKSDNEFFDEVYEHVIRVEFQGRGTLHIHVALWALVKAGQDLRGNTTEGRSSALVAYLESLGFKTVDVQYGEGFLNYIMGYAEKGSDSLDFSLKEHHGEDSANRGVAWRIAYRIMRKHAPLIPEIFVGFAGLPLMKRSYAILELYAPVQGPRMDTSGGNHSEVAYGHYLRYYGPNVVRKLSFLAWCRRFRVEKGKVCRRPEDPSEGGASGRRLAVGVDFAFELLDRYICQFFVMFFPHAREDEFCPSEGADLGYMKYFVGGLRYLDGLRWFGERGSERLLVQGAHGALYAPEAFPVPLPETPLGGLDAHGTEVFAGNAAGAGDANLYRETSLSYLLEALVEELPIRMSKKRVATALQRVRALGLLHNEIEREPAERERKVYEWNSSSARRALVPREWSPEQQEALDYIDAQLEISDANRLAQAHRVVAIAGEPGSGKSELLAHGAVRAADQGCHVLILCPTGSLVHSYRDRLPDTEKIMVDTVHASYCIGRKADVERVRYAPPSKLRRYDLIFLDEASQVEDHVASLIMQGTAELPQRPLLVLAADFQQLNPVEAGRRTMWRVFHCVHRITLETVHRTKDRGLLDFLKVVRLRQPLKARVRLFFAGRHWPHDLAWCVKRGLQLGREKGCTFSWLCVTNSGAEKVNAAALKHVGITEEDLEGGFPGEPHIKGANIVLRPGLQLRLTRNLDKERGFVNGALGTVHVVLARHTCVVKLSNGALVLLHPVSADGVGHLFLPCVYGYATTIRRAQGATLQLGCLYFDHCYPPERGYGYVGVSRFVSQAGVYHFGRIRRTDWLPVGGPGEPEEQEQREDSSVDSGDGGDDSDEYEAMTGEGGASAALRAVREGRVGEESSGDEESDPADFTTDSEAGAAEEDWSETSSSSGDEDELDSASASSGDFAEEPRLMYHEVVEMEEQLDDAAPLLQQGATL